MKCFLFLMFTCCALLTFSQRSAHGNLAPTPPMGWMTWNLFADRITEKEIREMADSMVSTGMVAAGYNYVIIDDGWQGGRDAKNNIIADAVKFPSGIAVLAKYIHSKGMKLGIYSDAAQLTCAGFTGSLGFEMQDAATFASWGIDYLKYDYCNAPADSATAKTRYGTMAAALEKSGRQIVLGICEWGHLEPWLWGAQAGGQLWRSTDDVRDKWQRKHGETAGDGITEIVGKSINLYPYAGPGHWNDLDMLVVGLNGKKGPSGDLGGTGCTNTEYQSQMTLWSMLNSPLVASNDVRTMDAATKAILMNKEVIAINQDRLGEPARPAVNDSSRLVLVKKLEGGDFAIAVLNKTDVPLSGTIDFASIGLAGTYEARDLWRKTTGGKIKKWKGIIASHETTLLRLKPFR